MTGFAGFPSGKNPYVPVPDVFFTVLLPEIEDSAELKVTLHLFWLLAQKQGNPRCVSDRDLLADRVLLRGLKRRGDPRPPEERLRQGLEQALARGTLLRIHLRLVSEGNDQAEIIEWYFFNTARSRKVVAELQGGEMVPVRLLNVEHEQMEEESEVAVPAGAYISNKRGEPSRIIQVQVERPNIFVLYEQNIGLLSPLIADQLKDAADQYPAEWIEAAFREAVLHNKRKWTYISAILRRWETEGRQVWNA
ncbi:MAG TPA: DnaD domain protein [Ktedonobacteraceae bacterium]|nr:DnaD domain protein [Ktedonobacteraceae bacterium]